MCGARCVIWLSRGGEQGPNDACMHETRPLFVRSLMLGQGALSREALSTVITWIRLLSSVHSLVPGQAALHRETLFTVMTWIRLLSSVRSLVLGHVALVRETLSTVIA